MSTITTPSIEMDMPEADYHADPVEGGSLSSTGAKRLLDSPARFRWEMDHPTPSSDAMDLGSAVHSLVLDAGPEVRVVEADSWRTASARAERDAARAGGSIPLLTSEWVQAQEMAAAVASHPTSGALLDAATEREVSLFAPDEQTGVWRRGRVDGHSVNLPRVQDADLVEADGLLCSPHAGSSLPVS